MSNFWVHLQKNFSGPLLSPNMKSHESRPNFHLHFSSAQTTEVPILLPFLENFDNLNKAFASASHTNNKKILISFTTIFASIASSLLPRKKQRERENILLKKNFFCVVRRYRQKLWRCVKKFSYPNSILSGLESSPSCYHAPPIHNFC